MSSEGLRARKQRQTRDAIHRAAVSLAVEKGPDAATVAAISERANISVRTFFNYYPTKEEAIVGLHEGLPSDAELDEFREGSGPDLIGDLIRLLLGVFWTADDELMAQRRALIAEHPHLVLRHWARLMGVEQRTARVVADRLRAAEGVAHSADVDAAAQALVVTCSGLLRLAIRQMVEQGHPPADASQRTEDMVRTLREVLNTIP